MKNLKKWYSLIFIRKFDCKGRSCREDYWNFMLIITLYISIATLTLHYFNFHFATFGFAFNIFYTLAFLFPGMPIIIRRLHDTNHSGKWLIPFYISTVLLFVLSLQFSTILTVINHEKPIDFNSQFFTSMDPTNYTIFIGSLIFLLIGFVIFIIFAIILLIFLLQRGTEGYNRFGQPYCYY